jgi:ATP-dependent DNA helicase RecG
MFTVTLRRLFDFEKWVEKWVEKLTDNRVKIIREVHNNPKVTKKELGQLISVSTSAIDILKDLGLLTREGSDTGGNWKIKFTIGG